MSSSTLRTALLIVLVGVTLFVALAGASWFTDWRRAKDNCTHVTRDGVKLTFKTDC